MRSFNKYGTMVAVAALFAASGTVAQAADADLQSLQQQINQLQQQLQAVQAKQAAAPSAAVAGAATVPTNPPAAGPWSSAAPGTTTGWLQYGTDVGGFVIPGTKTALKIGGNIKLDAAYDVDAGIGAAGLDTYAIRSPTTLTGQNGFALPGTAAARQQGRFTATAAYSRLYADTRTPTEFGEVKMYVETDFAGATSGGNQYNSNSHDLRIRHAYGTIGNWTFGQTWSIWSDRATEANSVDDNGPLGQDSGVRQALVSYRWDIDPAQKNQLLVSLENPFSDFLGADNETFTGAAGQNNFSNFNTKLPDFLARYAHNENWGRLFVVGMLRDLEANSAGVNNGAVTTLAGNAAIYTGPIHDSTTAWGVATGGKVFTGLGNAKNAVTFHGEAGQGIGRYMNFNSGSQNPSALLDANGKLKTLFNAGYDVSYQHFWDEKAIWQSNIIWGEQKTWFKDSLLTPVGQQGLPTDFQEIEVNLLWTPNTYVQMGPAYIRANTRVIAPYTGLSLAATAGNTRAVSGTTAADNRFQYSVNIGF
jgi:hypothetical protein